MALSLTRALCLRSLFPQVNASVAKPNYLLGLRAITIKVVPKPTEPQESYDGRNLRLKRELSPHLTIYKFQLTSTLSITHRFTGIALTGYASALGLGSLVLSHDFSHYITMIEGLQLSSPTLIALKFILAFPAAYHTLNGVRHLFWDTGRFLTIKEVYTTGYAMLGGTAAISVLLALL